MKVVVIGGAGVFGQRLAEMLVRDGHDVTIAGRNPDATARTAQTLGAGALTLDRAGDLSGLWAPSPDVVIDAAGPFHAYGDDPYRVPGAAIAAGCHYLDLADDAAFCAGISALDDAAQRAGVWVLSGASSVPGLSSAIAADLAQGQPIDLIESAILPGNRAPRGRAVVDSILHQAGTPIAVTLDGTAEMRRSWSAPKSFDLGPLGRRRGYAIRVPDQQLLPGALTARSVTFYAGLELDVMARGLAALSWLRAKTGLRLPTSFIHRIADALGRFGTDAGGMVVRVVSGGRDRVWRMIVRDGQGPYIPGVVARAILRAPQIQPPGARPAIAALSAQDATAAMADLAVTIDQTDTPVAPLFPRFLGADFAALPRAVRASHQVAGPLRLSGRARITRGAGVFPCLIAALFRFPAATDDIAVTVLKLPHDGAETWHRRFGDDHFQSTLRIGPRGMTETFGPFTFDLGLHIADNALHFPVRAGRCLGIPMPRALLPVSHARETEENGVFHFDVALFAPLTGQKVVHYRGWLRRDEDDKEA